MALTPDELALVESGNVLEEEVDLVAEQVAAGNLISQERFNEVETKLEEICQQIRDLNLSTENPVMSQLATQITLLNQQLAEMKLSMDTMLRNQQETPPKLEEPPVVIVAPVQQNPEGSTEEPKKDEQLEVVEVTEQPKPELEKTKRYQRL